MINGISFAGRETMLTEPAEKVVSKIHEYVGVSKIYDAAESVVKEAAKKVDDVAETAVKEAAKKVETTPVIDYSNRAAASYALSHGTPKEVLPEAVARSIDYTV